MPIKTTNEDKLISHYMRKWKAGSKKVKSKKQALAIAFSKKRENMK